MIDLEVFAERLKELMVENDFNATYVAKQISIDKSSMSRYLSAKIAPSLENAVKIAEFLNCSVDYLLGRVEFD